jgi:CubicO group peptidase (beta-lactamase class C family)
MNILYEEGFSYYSPISTEHPIDPSKSIFVIVSLPKTLIALSAMQFVEKSQLNLITDINKYLKFPNSIVARRHLLSHSSGLGSNYE